MACPEKTARPLGRNQRAVLECMAGRFEGGRPRAFPGGGWIWTNVSETVRLLESLERRGLVTVEGEHRGLMGDRRRWSINAAGLAAIGKGPS